MREEARLKRLDDSPYQDLVDAIYEAVLDPALWPTTLVRVSDAVSAIGAMFASLHLHQPQLALGRLDHLERHSQTCLWAKLPNAVPVGTVASSDAFVRASDLECTEFYDEILRPQRILHATVAQLARDAERGRRRDDARFEAPLAEPFLRTQAGALARRIGARGDHFHHRSGTRSKTRTA